MQGVRMNTLKFYDKERCTKMFNVIENPQWRIFKSIDEDGMCRQNKKQITSPEKLMKFIRLAKNPKALYVSISTFLSPNKNHGFFANQKIKFKDGTYKYPRKGYIYADCILIDSYFFIDLDDEKDFKNVISDAKKIIKKKKKPYLIQFSGTKGLHILYKMKLKKIADPIKRIEYIKQEKEKLAKELLKLNLKTIDEPHINVMTNVFAVYAMTHSIKLNGSIVQPLKLQGNELCVALTEQTREAKANDNKVAYAKDSSGKTLASHFDRIGQGAGLTSQSTFYCVDNSISKLKGNYITVIKKHIKKFNLNQLRRIQKLYKLSDFIITKVGNYVYAYNTKALQFERVLKIQRAVKSENTSFFLSRKHLPIQVSDTLNEEGKVIHKLEKISVLESKYGRNHPHSKPHSKLFGLEYPNMIGGPNNIGRFTTKGDMNT